MSGEAVGVVFIESSSRNKNKRWKAQCAKLQGYITEAATREEALIALVDKLARSVIEINEHVCPDCGVLPEEPHLRGACDIVYCTSCHEQLLHCPCGGTNHDDWAAVWMGEWPGMAEARAIGWFSRIPSRYETEELEPDLDKWQNEGCPTIEQARAQGLGRFADGPNPKPDNQLEDEE